MTDTDRLTVVAQQLKAKLEAKIDDSDFHDPPIRAVFYGDQANIPATPTVCIEPGVKRRTLRAARRYTTNDFEVFILIYHNAVQDDQQTRLDVDLLAEAIENFIHDDANLDLGVAGGRVVINGYISEFESGYTFRQNTMYRSVKMKYEAVTETQL